MTQPIELKDATDAQIVGAWNVLQFSERMICDKFGIKEKLEEISVELSRRKIPHETNKRIKHV